MKSKSDQAKFNKAVKKAIYRQLGSRAGREEYELYLGDDWAGCSSTPREIAETYVHYHRILKEWDRCVKAGINPVRGRRYSADEVGAMLESDQWPDDIDHIIVEGDLPIDLSDIGYNRVTLF